MSPLDTVFSKNARQWLPDEPHHPAPVLLNLDAGYPPRETYPVADLERLALKVLEEQGLLGALDYTPMKMDETLAAPIYRDREFPTVKEWTYGNGALREQIATWLGARQRVAGLDRDGVVLTSGAAQAISLVAGTFLDPGDGALVEALTFPYAHRFMQQAGADVRTVDIDADGLNVDALEQRLREFRHDGVRPKLLYTIPTFHLPTGAILPLERRKRVLELAEEWDLVVLEDAIYSDLGYGGAEIPPSLLHLDRSGRVVQVHGFSKIVVPGLRLGWLVADPAVARACTGVRQDLGVSQWLAMVMAEWLAEGGLDPHIARVNEVLRSKRDIAAAAMRDWCGAWTDFDLPQGGFYLWVRLDGRIDWDKVHRMAVRRGVQVRGTDAFRYSANGGPCHFRLSFSHAGPRELERGISMLGDVLSASLA